MKLLSLDISSKTGWSLFVDGTLTDRGLIELGRPILDFGPYPWCFIRAAQEQNGKILKLIDEHKPTAIVVEETNLGRNRYSQKFLEFLHCKFVESLDNEQISVYYINSSTWRKILGQGLSAEDRKNNSKLSRAKSNAKQAGKKLDKKALGIKGRIGKKHISVRWVNDNFGLDLKMKDNDIADAICLGKAYLAGAITCDGR